MGAKTPHKYKTSGFDLYKYRLGKKHAKSINSQLG